MAELEISFQLPLMEPYFHTKCLQHCQKECIEIIVATCATPTEMRELSVVTLLYMPNLLNVSKLLFLRVASRQDGS